MSETQHYTVLARKYRPSTFDDLIGQDAMVQTLRNAFSSGRIAQAYMLTGVRGVGKTTTARILARALNYSGIEGVDGPTIDMKGLGENCEAIMESRHVDVLEMDAASHTGVDNIREIIESARYKPVSARYKVYIIDEVHMLSKGAFNALLKTLEEPPEHVKFIFATTEIRKVPVTVLSRCQRFDLRRIGIDLLANHFKALSEKENIQASEDALALIARAAEGSARDGLSILDQAMAMGDGEITADTVRSMLGLADRMRVFDLIETVFKGDAGRSLELLDALYRDGAEPGQLLGDLAEAVHLMTRMKVGAVGAADQTMSEAERNKAKQMADKLSMPLLGRAWQMLLKGVGEVDSAPQPIAAVEMILVRMAYASELPPPDEIIRGLGNGSISRPPAGGGGGAHTNGGGHKMEVVAGGQRGYQPAPQIEIEQDVAVSHIPKGPKLESFEAVVAYVAEQRDIKLKLDLEDYARLVQFSQGRIELSLGSAAPKNLANDLGQKLSQWTGERWVIALSREPGQKTIAEKRNERDAANLIKIKEHPVFMEFMQHFPEAEIHKIREVKLEGIVDPDMDDPEDTEES